MVAKYPRSSKSNFWSNFFFCVSAAFQLAKTGCSPSAIDPALLLEIHKREVAGGTACKGENWRLKENERKIIKKRAKEDSKGKRKEEKQKG